MSTEQQYKEKDITKDNPIFSRTRTTIETAFYANNMKKISDVTTAYQLAHDNPNTIVTDLPIIHTTELDLPFNAKMLVDNHGAVVGRTAAARRLINDKHVNADEMDKLLREAIYEGHKRQFYKTEVIVGLDKDFMVKAHLAVPAGFEFNLLSYMLNFQFMNEKYSKLYQDSNSYDEGDIYLYCDPYWKNDNYPNGLALFDPEHNVAAILGLRYFGELKKATLTMTWAIAHRHGYTCSHGGEKSFHFKDCPDQVFAFYGLSGSGKSTLTHAKHHNKYDITVLHDDAFIINRQNGSSIALEPSYFDKTNDYLPGSRETKYFTTIMNVGVTLNKEGKKVIVSQDLRNGNGRTIKSRYASLNRIDKENSPITAIFWIMRDNSLPPVLKLNDSVTAATFGVTLATKRSSAENVIGGRTNNLVIEPFADPFRAYPLVEDYHDFKELFENLHLNCYIVNTDDFNGTDIPKEITLNIVEQIAKKEDKWEKFGPFENIEYMPIDGYSVDFNDQSYVNKFKERINTRLSWIKEYNQNQGELPSEIDECLTTILNRLN